MNDVPPASSCWDAFHNWLLPGLEATASGPREGPWQGNLPSHRFCLGYLRGQSHTRIILYFLCYCGHGPSRGCHLSLDHLRSVIFFFLPQHERCMCISPSLPSFPRKYVLSVSYVPDTVLGLMCIHEQNRQQPLPWWSLCSSWGRQTLNNKTWWMRNSSGMLYSDRCCRKRKGRGA